MDNDIQNKEDNKPKCEKLRYEPPIMHVEKAEYEGIMCLSTPSTFTFQGQINGETENNQATSDFINETW